MIRRRGQQQQQQAEPGPSDAPASGNQDPVDAAEGDGGPGVPTGDVSILIALYLRTSSNIGPKVAPNSDYLDSEDEAQVGRKRKVSKAALEKQKMAAKKRAKKRKDDDDDDYGDDDDDEYTALSKSLWKSKSINGKPSIGSMEKCAKCSKRFTVVCSSAVCGEHLIDYDL